MVGIEHVPHISGEKVFDDLFDFNRVHRGNPDHIKLGLHLL